jgi:phosphohistidine swiveling domain-containing protein
MNKPVITSFQPSLPEWFATIGNPRDAELLRAEDNSRTERFLVLTELAAIPTDVPEIFEASELIERSPRFVQFFETHQAMPSAIRLVPTKPDLPKLRDRGRSLADSYHQWFLQQKIEPGSYKAEIFRHCDTQRLSIIFVVNESAIAGEAIEGLHNQLTNGEQKNHAWQFYINEAGWNWSREPSVEVYAFVKQLVESIRINDAGKRTALQSNLNAEFTNDNLLQGYFEAHQDNEGRLTFIDYNRILHKLINPQALKQSQAATSILSGAIAFPGQVTGRVRIVDIENFDQNSFEEGDILVCDNTDVRFVPLMKKAGAIVTNRGGILSHAAIVARELKKPCIIGTGKATEVLKDGEQINVDATAGIITKL